MKSLKYILQFLFGAVFVASSLTKLVDISSFELYVFKQEWFSWDISANLAWLLVIGELLIGIAVLSFYKLKYSLAVANSVLVAFGIMLLYQILTGNLSENCNCFGELVKMDSKESLIKNIILLAIGIPLFFKPAEYSYKMKNQISIGVAVLSVVIIGFIRPANMFYIDPYAKSYDGKQFNLSIFENAEFSADTVDFSKGKHLVGFVLKACRHCKMSAAKIAVFKDKYPQLPVHFIFWGSKGQHLQQFIDNAGAGSIPYIFVSRSNFFRTAGSEFPAYFLIEDGEVKEKLGYQSLKDDLLVEFFGME